MAFLSISAALYSCISFGQEEFWINIFEVGGWPYPSTGDCAYPLDMVSTGSVSTLLGILANVLPIRSWEPLGI